MIFPELTLVVNLLYTTFSAIILSLAKIWKQLVGERMWALDWWLDKTIQTIKEVPSVLENYFGKLLLFPNILLGQTIGEANSQQPWLVRKCVCCSAFPDISKSLYYFNACTLDMPVFTVCIHVCILKQKYMHALAWHKNMHISMYTYILHIVCSV